MARAPERDVRARIDQARADAEAATEAVRARSQARLAELMAKRPVERLRELEDPDLIQADRVKLRESLASGLAPTKSRARRVFPSARLLRRLGPLLLRASVSPLGVAFVMIGLPWVAIAWSNTPTLGTLTQKGVVALALPNGTQSYVSLSPGSAVRVLSRRGDEAVIGIWVPRAGYGTARIPTGALR